MKFLCLGCVVLVVSASSAAAEEQRKIPLVEVGLVLPVSIREEESPSSVGGGSAGETNAALSMRVDLSVLGLLIESYLPKGFRIGDYLGFDLGISQQGNLAGRVLAGVQASYEINHQVGVGLRGYYVNTFEDLLPGAFGSHFIKTKMIEASGRFGGVIVRARIGENERLQGTLGDVGFSLRIPTSWKIIDYKGWLIGLDYDRFTNPDRGPDQISAYTIHRITGVFLIGF